MKWLLEMVKVGLSIWQNSMWHSLLILPNISLREIEIHKQLLTHYRPGEFCRNMTPVAGNLYSGQSKINCYFINGVPVITFNSYTWCTHKVFSSMVSFILTFHTRINHSGFLSFWWSNTYIIWIRTIFWRTIIVWDTSTYVAWIARQSICITSLKNSSSLKILQCIIFEIFTVINLCL